MKIHLQNRDFHIIRELGCCRFLTLPQIADLCFEGKREAAKKRLQKLQRGGIVKRHSLGILVSSVYFLSAKGFRLTKRELPESLTPSVPALTMFRHEKSVRNFRAAIMRDAKREGIEIPVFSLNPKDLRFEIGNRVLRSEGYFEIILDKKVFRYFVEVDLGTEAHAIVVARVVQYQQLFKSGLFAYRRGGDPEAFQLFPFRVLFLFSSDGRLRSFLARLYKMGCEKFVLARKSEDALRQPFDSFWPRACTQEHGRKAQGLSYF